MGLFKLRKNKKFNYESRYYKGSGSPFEIKHKFEDERVTEIFKIPVLWMVAVFGPSKASHQK